MGLIKKTMDKIKPKKVLNSGYGNHGASRYKKSLLGFIANAGNADADIVDNIETLRERSRDEYMGVPIATGALKTVRTNVVGGGLVVKPQINADFLGLTEEEADELEKTIKREFNYWAESVNCDICRHDNFKELQQLAFLSWMMSGDCFVLLPVVHRNNDIYDLKIQLIEADRVCNPYSMYGSNLGVKNSNISGGVEIGEYGEVVAYHVCNQHPLAYKSLGQQFEKPSWTRVEVFGKLSGRPNILHLMVAERPEQRRGVPLLAPVIEQIKQLGRYTDAELMATVINSFYTVFITSELPIDSIGGITDTIDDDESSVELGNGSLVELEPGQNIQEAKPSRPFSGFDSFTINVCRQIGSALELPSELLLKSFTSSYSASRACLLEAWKTFRMQREWFANDFCQPIYEEWFHEAVLKGRIKAKGFLEDPIIRKEYTRAVWHGASMGQLDPLKEVQASQARVENGFSTRAQETIELNGRDWADVNRQLAKENILMKMRPNNEEDKDIKVE